MSSSVFVESSCLPGEAVDYAGTSDSNLVVVYGKNGISFDDKGLENLIEEKQISSISVIRLTSPTPSMEEEEEEQAKLEDMLRRQEHSGESSSDEEKNSRASESDKRDDENDTQDNDSSDCREKQEDEHSVKGSDDEATEDPESRNKKLSRQRSHQSNATKIKRTSRKRKRVRPEIVGLRLEEFYPPEDANEIIKEALKMAGLGPDRKSKEDFEFQLFVIRNDHCYTPFTSPTQMKAKLAADKLEIEKQASRSKVIGVYQTTVGGGKQIFVRKKLMQKQEIPIVTAVTTSSFAKDKGTTVMVNKIKKDCADVKPTVETDCTEEDDNIHSPNEENDATKAGEQGEDSEYALTGEESGESDNDRDSDLDFDVNNPKGRRRKVRVAKFIKRHSVGVSKIHLKTKRYQSQEEPAEVMKKSPSLTIVNRPKSLVKSTSDVGRIIVRPAPTKIVYVGGGVSTGLEGSCGQIKILSPSVAALPPIPRKQGDVKCSTATSILSATSTPSGNISHKAVMLKGPPAVNTSPQSHREILINKQIMSSPKTKGFTELSTLIAKNAREESGAVHVEAQKSVHTTTAAAAVVAQKLQTTHKGFMPIGLETAATNQLPAQISIQTHQSSSELEAEHDKQLDLINSIVQDELKKPNEVVSPATNINENIPELVKMLESTEKVLENTNISKKEDCNLSNINNDSRACGNTNIYGSEVSQTNDSTSMADIDINNASLLATPDGDDDLPDDILQLVDMMQDDKTLQEAVKVLGAGDCTESISNASSSSRTIQKPPPLTLITQHHPAPKINILEDIPHSSKSIIQMSISNLPVQSMTPRPSITPARAASSKSSPLVRSEPIQIIRGNGRVITLPPIEAPTTRAKRRAQVQPHSIIQHTSSASLSAVPLNVNESSLDNSMHSNSSVTSVSSVAQDRKGQDTSNSRRRGSKEHVTASSGSVGNQKAKGRSTASKKVRSKPQSEVNANESANEDDDDPNKLWCICRQPHNNRFMICCDACEDWFHGTCVNITKAMGLEMEQKGVDWTCPKCVRKQEEKRQPKITDLLVKKPIESTPQLSAEYYPTVPIAATTTTAAVQPVIADAIVSAIKIQQQSISNIQAKEITQTVIDTTKTRLQPGQFINLKDLSSGGKKVIIQAASSSSGQKKLFVTTQSLRTASTLATPIRTIAVVKHIPGRGNQMQQHQSIKVIRTISPAKSSTQSFVTTTAPSSKSIISSDTITLCIVCKKPARRNSIYCSDDCIRKHAQNALHTFMTKTHAEVDAPLVSNAPEEKAKKKPKGLFEDLLSMADRKPKVERVNVYERKSGRILMGSNAPTISNLKKWLQENPTFEVVQPGSLQAVDIEKKQKLRTLHSSSPTAPPKSATSPPPLKLLPLSSPVQQKTDLSRSNSPQTPAPVTLLKHTLTPQLKANKSIVDFVKSSPPSVSRPGTPKQLQKYPQNVSIKADKTPKPSEDVKLAKEKTNSAKKQASAESSNNKSTNSDGEPIRLLVRRTLKEQLLLRTQDEDSCASTPNSTDNSNISDFSKLTPEEIQEFANATELEMYNYFNRDAGIKYKAKYRSLIFNIKDRKNRTLFAKICRKQIEPKQLVRMTPDEMASQELAQWRKQENKHQLEMIKKSELDLLSCAKNYVLKTHKGEEVIESKSAEYENVDISIPVEDVVAALNKTDFAQESVATTRLQNHRLDVESTLLPLSNVPELQPHPVEDKLKPSKDKDKERDKEKDRHRDRDRNRDGREREKRHKSKDPYRDKSHSRKRSRSHSRSRSQERNEKRHKSSHKDDKRDRDKDRVKERSDRDHHGDGRSNDKKTEKKPANISKTREISLTKRQQHHEQYSNPLETYNLIDQILESTKTVEEAANLVPDRDKDLEMVRKTSGTPLPSQPISSTTSKGSVDTSCVIDIHASPVYVESDQEPTSTVSIPTPPHDPYSRFMSLNSLTFDDTNCCSATTLWTGDINMVDVASFQLSVQPVLGTCLGLAKLLAKELDIVGRIGPETVWDYISKIKKSPNKEIVIIRLIPASESETSAYKILYEYLDNRNRLGVVKSVSPYIKDFYIYPLGAGKQMPMVLRHNEPVEFYDDPCRPDMLIGIIIRVVGKRQSLVTQPTTTVTANNPISGSSKFVSRTIELDSSQSPPGSPKVKKRRQSIGPKDIDVDAIIKAPIVSKSQKAMPTAVSSALALTDADEPYSPGGSSDDDLPLLPVKLPATSSNQMQTAEDELKRKMEEINRQIAAQEMEIAGLLTGESSKFGSNPSKKSKVLANIAIPSNLSQILASIKPTMVSQDPQTAVPPPPPLIGSITNTATSSTSAAVNEVFNPAECKSSTSSSSRLANLSEAELLSMVPDDIALAPKPPPTARYEEPPPPGV